MTTDSRSALIAMSGGVDSAVASYLMQQAGYRCMGATMHLRWNADAGLDRRRTCCSRRDAEDAREVADLLQIPFEVLVCSEEFRARVIDKFVAVYASGGTPNPCIDCNRYLKFGTLLQAAQERGYDFLATGHYARICREGGRYLLKKALHPEKDQSYVLYMLTQEQLAKICFPLGELDKSRVREIAQSLGLPNAQKRDSQDICFIPDGDYGAFLESYTGRECPAGDFLDEAGHVVGRHRGAARYTLGQRKGLGLAMGAPVYVCGKDMDRNTVTVGPETSLYRRTVLVEDMNWIALDAPSAPLRVRAKTRYRQAEQAATAWPEAEGCVRLEFDAPQRAVTAGQAAVLYDGDVVVGGGTIRGTV